MKFNLSRKDLIIFEIKLERNGICVSSGYHITKLGLGRTIYRNIGGHCIGFVKGFLDSNDHPFGFYEVYIEKLS